MPKTSRPNPARFVPYTFPPPSPFTDPARREKIAAAFPAIQRVFRDYCSDQNVPGLALGIVMDGELAFVQTLGVQAVETNAPVTPDTVFRIASMSKSFVAMAIVRLRDERKLKLDDPVARYIPEFKKLVYPTTDSAVLTLRHLLTMSPGFPEDNPWGDRQMAITDREFTKWLKAGIPFAHAPNDTFEYSNYGYAILGRIVSRVSGIPYQKYITKHILKPLGMSCTVWSKTQVPVDRLALGYRYELDLETGMFAHKPEPILGDGAFAGMAGLFTTVPDFARYMTFLMDAFPARDGIDDGPVKRATAREMQQFARYEELVRRTTKGDDVWHAVTGYGFGLAVWHDEHFGYGVSHGGGLPGYGSYYYLLPHHGVGVVALTNKTYSRVGSLFTEVLELLSQTGGMQLRPASPAPILVELQSITRRWLEGGSDAELEPYLADNFVLDGDLARRRASLDTMRAELGDFVRVSEMQTLNALRGKWNIECKNGFITVLLTLAPTMPPTIQMIQWSAHKRTS